MTRDNIGSSPGDKTKTLKVFSLSRAEAKRADSRGPGAELLWDLWKKRLREGGGKSSPAWCSGWSSSPADTLQTHSGLFLEELEMMVPSTPTSASGAFWKGSELGSEPAAPSSTSTTSEVVKSKSASYWPTLHYQPVWKSIIS